MRPPSFFEPTRDEIYSAASANGAHVYHCATSLHLNGPIKKKPVLRMFNSLITPELEKLFFEAFSLHQSSPSSGPSHRDRLLDRRAQPPDSYSPPPLLRMATEDWSHHKIQALRLRTVDAQSRSAHFLNSQ